MTKTFERTALILLAGTALTAWGPIAIGAPLVQEPQVLEAAPIGDAVDTFQRSKPTSYKVRRGDTLAEIADRLGSDVATLAKLNGLKKPYRLTPGQTIKGPRAAGAPAPKSSGRSSGSGSGGSYTVKSGDTLFSISQKTGVTVEQLRAANGMGRSSSISPGRKLKLPGGEPEAEAADEAPPERSSRTRRPTPPERVVVPEEPSAGRSATGRVITIDTPGPAYRVKKGDNLDRVARRLNSDIDELARINKLKRPYRLQPGQTIRGPGGSAKAYVVARGDTLAEIAQRFSVSVDKLRTTNGLRRGASVAPGRRLRLPAGYRDRGPVEDVAPVVRERPSEPPPVYQRPSEPPPVYQRPSEPQPSRPRESQPPPFMRGPPPAAMPPPRDAPLTTTPAPATPAPAAGLPTTPQPYSGTPRPPPRTTPSGPVPGAPTASPAVSDAQISQMGRGLFAWPVRGQILSNFGSKGTGQRNDGLNIRAITGDSVRAAAGGEVVYAGDQVPGFGNLVLIKHADGWVTAYGHLSRVGVRMQQRVEQGQEIGSAGSSGGVSEPQLHFEVRYAPTPQERARPVDPELVLPR